MACVVDERNMNGAVVEWYWHYKTEELAGWSVVEPSCLL